MEENQNPQSETPVDENSELDKKLEQQRKLAKDLKIIVTILSGVFVFRSVVYEPFRIPSGSMIPTLMIGDFILVNKLSYGFKVPFSDVAFGAVNSSPIYLFGKKDPERGDVVVFKYPQEPSVNYIKRVVGVPGDSLEIKNKVLYINNVAVENKEIDGKDYLNDMDDKFKGYNLKFYQNKITDHSFVTQYDSDNIYKSDMAKIKIPPGKFFMMGDNRDFSYDSRFWGLVSFEQIRGKAVLIWFSFIFPFSDSPTKFRPWRIGKDIN